VRRRHPRPLARTLFGKGAVHVHDGKSHRHRKAMFLSLLDLAAARELAAVADRLWQAAVDRWRDGGRVVVFDAAVRVIGLAICGWAGLPLTSQLDDHTAAVELLNIVRPTVAVAWFVSFAALALHEHPQWRQRLATGSRMVLDDDLEAFVHEVRRLYPFAPLLGARVDRSFTWRGNRFPQGRLVLLDVYGTNHDPKPGLTRTPLIPPASSGWSPTGSRSCPVAVATRRPGTAAPANGWRWSCSRAPSGCWPTFATTSPTRTCATR
jgi:cytochrome P450